MIFSKYEAVFKDKFGTNTIVIYNNFKELSFELRGAKFKGISLDDFELITPDAYSKKELNQFSFNKFTNKKGDLYELFAYELQFSIPTVIFKVLEGIYLQNNLNLKITAGNPAKNGGIDFLELKLSIQIHDELFEAQSDFFEPAAIQIQKQFKGKYKFKNCFGCNYSDYSVYGQGLFGTMFCFANQKSAYLKVKSKMDYMNLAPEKMTVQETFICEEFEFRGADVAYRG